MCSGHLDWSGAVTGKNWNAASTICDRNCFSLLPAVHMQSKIVLSKVMQTR